MITKQNIVLDKSHIPENWQFWSQRSFLLNIVYVNHSSDGGRAKKFRLLTVYLLSILFSAFFTLFAF